MSLELLPIRILRLVYAYYGRGAFISGKHDWLNKRVEDWDIVWNVFHLRNRDIVNIASLGRIYYELGFKYLKHAYEKFDFQPHQLTDCFYVTSDIRGCHSYGLLQKMVINGDCEAIKWILSFGIIYDKTKLQSIVKGRADKMVINGGIEGIELYLILVGISKEDFKHTMKSTLFRVAAKNGDINTSIWISKQVNIRIYVIDSILVRSVYKKKGLSGLIDLSSKTNIRFTDIRSGDDEIIRRASKNGDYDTLSWIFDTYNLSDIYHPLHKIYKYAIKIGEKRGNYVVVKLFIDRFGNPSLPVNLRRLYAAKHIPSKYMLECVSCLNNLQLPTSLVYIISNYYIRN